MMLLRRLLQKFLVKFQVQRDVPAPIEGTEHLARFLFSSKQFAKTNGKIKFTAFTPQHGETSVFRKNRLAGDYSAVKQKVESVRRSRMKATALIEASKISGIRVAGNQNILSVKPEESEHKWHANILGWPDNKQAQKAFAIKLAKLSWLELD